MSSRPLRSSVSCPQGRGGPAEVQLLGENKEGGDVSQSIGIPSRAWPMAIVHCGTAAPGERRVTRGGTFLESPG
jgi:hypothetical protein